jgi:hypothetical protein
VRSPPLPQAKVLNATCVGGGDARRIANHDAPDAAFDAPVNNSGGSFVLRLVDASPMLCLLTPLTGSGLSPPSGTGFALRRGTRR